MKKTSIAYSVAMSLFLICLLGCKASTPDAAPTCKLKSSLTTTTLPQNGITLGNTSIYDVKYEYDSKGNVIKMTNTSSGQASNGSNAYNQTNVVTYAYNADGFMTSNNFQSASSNGTPFTVNKTFEYANGKLTKQTEQLIGTPPTNGNTTYEYDASGSLTKVIAFNSGSSGTGTIETFTYANGILIGHTQRTNNVDTQPLTIQNGLVMRKNYNVPTNYITYQYDAQERQTRVEEYYAGVLSSYYTIEYEDNMKSHSGAITPYKGFPLTKSQYGKGGVVKKYEYFLRVQNAMVQFNKTISTNQANARGYVATGTDTNNQYSTTGVTIILNSIRTYTYADCD